MPEGTTIWKPLKAEFLNAMHVSPQVEKTRHFLLLREKLGDSIPKSLSDSLSPSLSCGTLSTSTSISSQMSSATFESAVTPSESSGYDSVDIESLVDREKELATKVGNSDPLELTAGLLRDSAVRLICGIRLQHCLQTRVAFCLGYNHITASLHIIAIFISSLFP